MSYYMNLRCLNIKFSYIYTSALTHDNSRAMRLQLQECVNSKGMPVKNYNHAPHKSLQH
jgi:antitoxin component of RelBE/YafQ-DinJ toxin-antitoxin module